MYSFQFNLSSGTYMFHLDTPPRSGVIHSYVVFLLTGMKSWPSASCTNKFVKPTWQSLMKENISRKRLVNVYLHFYYFLLIVNKIKCDKTAFSCINFNPIALSQDKKFDFEFNFIWRSVFNQNVKNSLLLFLNKKLGWSFR